MTTSIKAVSHSKWSPKAQGASFVDYLKVSYDRLVQAFGEPVIKTDEYKTDAEWHVSFYEQGSDWTGPEDAFVTIYNYKNGKNYLGANGLNVQDIDTWHVGAKSKSSFWTLQDFLKPSRRRTKRIDL